VATFHSLKVKDIYKETSDCSVVSLEVPKSLESEFRFRQGQHLVKQIPGGLFSSYVNEKLQPGDILEVMAPSGNFGVDNCSNSKRYVAFAAGSGITPILSMISSHLEREPHSTFQLFYLNRTVKSIIFKEDLEQLRNQYFGRLEIYYFLTQERRDIELFNGRFTAEKLEEIYSQLMDVANTDEVFLCGPEEMVFLVRDTLKDKGFPSDHIHYELFVSGLTEEDKQRIERLAQQKVEGVEVTLIDGGKEFHFTMTKDYDNLLDAALGAGADLPFACKGGVCSTCKCKVLEGEVEMKVNYALESDELSQHYVLSCQSVPLSTAVKIDFDV